MLKQKLGAFCKTNPALNKLIFEPYAQHCEKKTQAAKAERLYDLADKEKCLADCVRERGINFWFLLEQGHNNIGDIAIGLAEQRFYDQNFPQYPKHYVYEEVYNKYKEDFKCLIAPEDVIILRGGGSIGNTYRHEALREEIISKYRDNLIISMPQTMSFPNSKSGKRGRKAAQKAYAKCKQLLLVAREERSYQDMLDTFPKNNVLLTPDIVMSLSPDLPERKREGIILCLRADWEKSLSEAEHTELKRICARFSSVTPTDMYAAEEFIPRMERKRVLNEKLLQFASAQLVVTDRLHGMVLSAITGTPCIALSNYNHKVIETYKWLKDLPYITFCSDISETEQLIPSMLAQKECKWNNDFAKPYFAKIVEYIEENMK